MLFESINIWCCFFIFSEGSAGHLYKLNKIYVVAFTLLLYVVDITTKSSKTKNDEEHWSGFKLRTFVSSCYDVPVSDYTFQELKERIIES